MLSKNLVGWGNIMLGQRMGIENREKGIGKIRDSDNTSLRTTRKEKGPEIQKERRTERTSTTG